jgi:von Willebrand factor type A domain/Putative Flp pilus-assembly TadE/G-like
MIGRRKQRREGEQGQVLVLFVIMLVLILTTLALIINGGVLRRSNQEQWNALDSGALAGAQSLPANPAQATSDALKYALMNHPGLSGASLVVTFRCLVGDRNNDGQPDAGDVPAVCNPGSGATWTCTAGKCVAVCNPSIAGRTCNTVVVTGTVNTAYQMSGVTGINGATTTYTSAACSGLCGADPAVPLDIGIIIDRTSSMSDADLNNVKNAALSMLRIFDPTKQYVGMAVLGQSQTAASCSGTGNARGLAVTTAGSGTWVVVPYPTNKSLSKDYLSGGALNPNSSLVRTIQCLDHSSTGTDLGDPLLAMANTLVARGRSGVPKGIIMMTDGAANQPDTRSCKYANDKATTVKNMGIEVFTIGFGVVGDMCVDIDGTYRNASASDLLADMATGPTTDNGCTDAENADGDHYFCEPRSNSLASVFNAAATALVKGSARLVSVP